MSLTMKDLKQSLAREGESYEDDHEIQVCLNGRYYTVREAFLTGADASNATSTGMAFVLEVDPS